MACCVLHNIAIDQDDDFYIDLEDSSYGDSNESCNSYENVQVQNTPAAIKHFNIMHSLCF